MKKSFVMVVVSVITAAMLFTACSSAPAAKPTTNTSDKKIKIEYWHVNAETQGGAAVEALIKQFNQSNDHIEVVGRYNPDMYKGLMQNLQAEAAAGKSPAVVQIGWAFIDYFSNNFKFTSPQDITDKYFPQDKTFLKDNFLPNVMALAVNRSSVQVGIPYSVSNPVLYYNADLFKKAGLPEEGPKTWEDVIAYAKQIKEKTGKYGFYMQEPADNWAQQAFLESNGAKMITKDGEKFKASFASPEGIAAYEKYADMVLKDKSALHLSWNEGVQSFIDGNVGMLFTTIARRANIQNGAKFDARAVNAPIWNGKKRVIPAGGCFLAITAQSTEEQKAAWEFTKFLYSVESMAAWTKGTGYVPPRKDVADAPNGLKDFLAENKMMAAATTQMGDIVSWTSFPGDAGIQAEQILIDTRDQILGGKKSASDGLTEAQNKINMLLK